MVLPMARARKHLVCLSDTPYYHVTSRCVRRAFLCGVDAYSGQSYEHRRSWIEDRLRVLSSLFSIDLCAYAIMSNHYHLVVRLNPGETAAWSDAEVLKRWTTLFRGPLLVQRFRDEDELTAAELATVHSVAAVYRDRLGNLSWFMKCLNEPIARKANAEDRCTGHFWEARFHSQPLMSDQALMTAMAYVDLNPVRAGMARTPEQSRYTSIRARLKRDGRRNQLAESIERLLECGELHHFDTPVRSLMRFADGMSGIPKEIDALPMTERDYLALVDATGRLVARGKRGRIDPGLEPILSRLGLSPEQWVQCSTAFSVNYRNGDLRQLKTA
jgi:REP element-mobilizing transposase RayT